MLLLGLTLNGPMLLTMLASFVAIAAMVWLIGSRWTQTGSLAQERLERFSRLQERAPSLVSLDASQDDGEQREAVAEPITGWRAQCVELLSAAAPSIGKALEPKKDSERGKLRQRLVEAGFRGEQATLFFLTLKGLLALAVLLISGGVAAITGGLSQGLLTKVVVPVGLAFYIPEFVLSYLGSTRKKKLSRALPDFLDLLVVSVEAGLGIDQALRRVTEELGSTYPQLADEINLANMQMQMGQPRRDVLRDLGARSGVDDLRALTAVLIQADKFGSSVSQALRVQSEALRTKRQQIAEEKAAKTAVKMIFPLVIFIFPGVFAVLIGPAGIQMAREMLPAMAALEEQD
jgi:tight adherence protein C